MGVIFCFLLDFHNFLLYFTFLFLSWMLLHTILLSYLEFPPPFGVLVSVSATPLSLFFFDVPTLHLFGFARINLNCLNSSFVGAASPVVLVLLYESIPIFSLNDLRMIPLFPKVMSILGSRALACEAMFFTYILLVKRFVNYMKVFFEFVCLLDCIP